MSIYMEAIIIKKLILSPKKWKIIIPPYLNNGRMKSLYIGDSKYQDFTQHNDEKRKWLYINRHRKNEDWYNPLTNGFWSRYLLWNKKTIKESISDIENKFHFVIILDI